MKSGGWKFVQASAIVCGVLVSTLSARAQSGDAILDLLLKKGMISSNEAKEVRSQADAQMAQTLKQYNKVKLPGWIDSMKFYGDLRLRADSINFETDPATGQPYLPNQLLWRYRLRLGMEAKFVEWATVNVRLMSGSGDPASGNQSFDQSFRKFGINVDVASVTLQRPGHDEVTLIAGKMDNPVWAPKFASPMLWDNDVTPSGVAEQLQWKFGNDKQYRLFATAGQYVANLLGSTAADNYVFDQEAGVEVKLGRNSKKPLLKLTAAGGYLFTENLANVSTPQNPSLGNALVGPGAVNKYLGDFQVAYGRGEVAWNITDKPFLGTPAVLTLSGEYIKNFSDAYSGAPQAYQASTWGDQTQGWTLQAAFGDAKKKGEWQVLYQYKVIQANSTWDTITDSDFGTGGTDRRGHIVKANYNVFDWWQLTFTSIITEKISNYANPTTANPNHDQYGWGGQYQLRIQADTTFKF
jgi:hypothetical protein